MWQTLFLLMVENFIFCVPLHVPALIMSGVGVDFYYS